MINPLNISLIELFSVMIVLVYYSVPTMNYYSVTREAINGLFFYYLEVWI